MCSESTNRNFSYVNNFWKSQRITLNFQLYLISLLDVQISNILFAPTESAEVHELDLQTDQPQHIFSQHNLFNPPILEHLFSKSWLKLQHVFKAAIVNKCHIKKKKKSGHKMAFVYQKPTETKAYMEKSGVSSQLLNY